MHNTFKKHKTVEFTRHAVEQMFSRAIKPAEVKGVINDGEIVQSYPDDKPFPSYLILGYINERPIHVVIAFDEETKNITVITAYVPSKKLWAEDYKNRK